MVCTSGWEVGVHWRVNVEVGHHEAETVPGAQAQTRVRLWFAAAVPVHKTTVVPVGRRVAVDVQAQARLDATDGAVG
jgi:hypothetical protein